MSMLIIAAAVMAADITAGLLFMHPRLAKVLSTRYTLAFAAGAMLTLAFVELMPQANLGLNAMYLVLGFAAFYAIDKVLVPRCRREEHVTPHGMGMGCVISMASDNVVDGLGIAVGYLLSPELGLLMTLAVVLHEVPQGITSAAIMRNLKFRLRTIITILAVAGSMYALGMSLSAIIPAEMLGILLAFVAGSFIYSGSRFVATNIKGMNLRFIGTLAMGVATMYLLESLVA